MKQLKDLNKRPVEGFSAGLKDDDDPFVWEIMIMGPPDTPYEGGFFQAEMNFPKEYPNMPPTLRFISDIVHPNVYPDGKLCMSILHPPGEDQWGYESASDASSPRVAWSFFRAACRVGSPRSSTAKACVFGAGAGAFV